LPHLELFVLLPSFILGVTGATKSGFVHEEGELRPPVSATTATYIRRSDQVLGKILMIFPPVLFAHVIAPTWSALPNSFKVVSWTVPQIRRSLKNKFV